MMKLFSSSSKAEGINKSLPTACCRTLSSLVMTEPKSGFNQVSMIGPFGAPKARPQHVITILLICSGS